MSVRKIASWVPVSDEMVVDYGIGTEADQAAAQTRLDRKREKSNRYWRSLPAHVRLSRTLQWQRWRAEDRFMRWLHSRLFPDHDE